MPERSPFTSARKTGTPMSLRRSASTCNEMVLPVPVAPLMRPCRFASFGYSTTSVRPLPINKGADIKSQDIFLTSRAVITFNKSPDVGFDRSIYPYRGCEHGCVYCFARPSHAYLGLSPGLDFESRLFYKPDAAAQLR